MSESRGNNRSAGRFYARCLLEESPCQGIPVEESRLVHEICRFSSYWTSRMGVCGHPKRNVAAEVLRRGLVRRGQTIYLDGGSTFVYLAARLLDHASELAPLRVVTGNAVILSLWMMHPKAKQISLETLGGDYVPDHCCTSGTAGMRRLAAGRQPDIDRAFLGVCRLDPRTGIYASISDVFDIKKMAIERAREVTVLVDETKLAAGSFHDELVARMASRNGCLSVAPEDDPQAARPATVFVGGCTEIPENGDRRRRLGELLPPGATLEDGGPGVWIIR